MEIFEFSNTIARPSGRTFSFVMLGANREMLELAAKLANSMYIHLEAAGVTKDAEGLFDMQVNVTFMTPMVSWETAERFLGVDRENGVFGDYFHDYEEWNDVFTYLTGVRHD